MDCDQCRRNSRKKIKKNHRPWKTLRSNIFFQKVYLCRPGTISWSKKIAIDKTNMPKHHFLSTPSPSYSPTCLSNNVLFTTQLTKEGLEIVNIEWIIACGIAVLDQEWLFQPRCFWWEGEGKKFLQFVVIFPFKSDKCNRSVLVNRWD